MEEKSKRINSLDYLRAFAIVCVVLCHATQSYFYVGTANVLQKWDVLLKLYVAVSMMISRLGVPIFLMLSGTLIIRKNFENSDSIKNFYKKNLIPLIIVTEIWIIIYNIYSATKGNITVNRFVIDLVKTMLFLKSVNFNHMWYMPAIIGIYIVIPFISIIVKNTNKKILLVPLAFAMMINMCLPSLNPILKLMHKGGISLIIDKSFIGGFYGVYLIAGFYLYDGLLRKKKTRYIAVYTFICMILTILYQFVLFNNNIAYDLWYNNIFLFATSVGWYELFLRIKDDNGCTDRFVCLISKYSLGIFFLHAIVQKILDPYINKMDVLDVIKVLIMFLLNFVICFGVIYISKFIKPLQKHVFFVK